MKRTLKVSRCLLLALLAGPAIERSFAGDAAPAVKRAPLGQVKTKFGSPSAGMPQPQRPSTAQTTGRVVRNAIGLPVGHAEGLVRGDGVRHEAPALAQGRAAGTLGIAAGGSGSLAKLQGSLGGMRISIPVGITTTTRPEASLIGIQAKSTTCSEPSPQKYRDSPRNGSRETACSTAFRTHACTSGEQFHQPHSQNGRSRISARFTHPVVDPPEF
jgi:hypothetical protein